MDSIYHKQVIMVYLVADKFFACCHWWNKLTGKIQGGSQKNHKEGAFKIVNI